MVGRGYTLGDGAYLTGALDPGTYKVYFDAHDGIFAPQWYHGRDDVLMADPVIVDAGAETAGVDAFLGFA